MSTLLILDGHALVHRAYHAIPPLSQNNIQVNAIYGFFSTLISLVETYHPKYLAICMDPPGPVFRNQEFVGYRSQRKPADPQLKNQFPVLQQALTDAHLPYFSVGGYEADDAIGTLAMRAFKKRRKVSKDQIITKVLIASGDRDMTQLVNGQVHLLMPQRGISTFKEIDEHGVVDIFSVRPDQVTDLKALTGDSSDNYPGVPGIGPVAALELLGKYQSLDNIYANLPEVKESVRQKLESNKENAYLSKKLATIVTDVPLDFKLKPLKLTPQVSKHLVPVLQSFNFKSLVTRLQSRGAVPAPTVVNKSTDPDLQPSLF